MRSLVAGATSPRPLRTRETVGADTPASAAMTEMVTSRDGLPATEPPSYPHRVRALRTFDGRRASAFRTGAPPIPPKRGLDALPHEHLLSIPTLLRKLTDSSR